MEKHTEIMHQKLVPEPFSKEPNIPFKYPSKIFWKRLTKWPLKTEFYFFFWTQSLFMDIIIKKN